MAYVETDFLLALITPDDRLGPAAEAVYEERDDLWTSTETLVELMLVAYREDWDVLTVVTSAKQLVTVRGDVESIIAAASYVDDEGLTPLDALHLVRADGEPIVSSDAVYDDHADRIALEDRPEAA
ncbi:MAG: PIN domain-containing protein [Halococcoides sp.]